MKINKESWHYKVWKSTFSMSHEDTPKETDLCRYCQRIFWQILLFGFLGGGILATVGLVLFILLYLCLWQHPLRTMATVGAIATIIALIALYRRWLSGRVKKPESESLIRSWVAARKQRVCPLVEFTE